MTFREELEQLRKNDRIKANPSLIERYDAVCAPLDKVKKPTTAPKTEALVVEFLTRKGHQGQKITTAGTFIPGEKYQSGAMTIRGKDKYIPGGNTKGAADITSSIYGLKVDWELKFSKGDRQSEKQKVFQERVENSGGLYYIFRDIDHFYELYNDLMQLPQIELMKQFHENKTVC